MRFLTSARRRCRTTSKVTNSCVTLFLIYIIFCADRLYQTAKQLNITLFTFVLCCRVASCANLVSLEDCAQRVASKVVAASPRIRVALSRRNCWRLELRANRTSEISSKCRSQVSVRFCILVQNDANAAPSAAE